MLLLTTPLFCIYWRVRCRALEEEWGSRQRRYRASSWGYSEGSRRRIQGIRTRRLTAVNGQIAESEYRQYHSPATFKHYKYVYDYDRMGRLLGADFRRSEQGGWTNASTFDVSELSYDANGNLLKLKRHPNTGGYIDNLSFAYTSGT